MNRHVAQIFRALADETRLRMLFFLTKADELCVCDFIALLDISQSKASRHLRYLLHAGLLQDRPEAVWVYYRLATPMGREQNIIMSAIRKIATASEDVELRRQLDERRKAKRCAPPAGASPRRQTRNAKEGSRA